LELEANSRAAFTLRTDARVSA